jgi:hypothetical protein
MTTPIETIEKRPLWYTELVNDVFRDTRITHVIDVGIDWAQEVSVGIYKLEDGRSLICKIPLELIKQVSYNPETRFPFVSIEHYLFVNYWITIGEPIRYRDMQKRITITYIDSVCQYCNTPVIKGQTNCHKCGGPYIVREEKTILDEKVEIIEPSILVKTQQANKEVKKDFERESTRSSNQTIDNTIFNSFSGNTVSHSWLVRCLDWIYSKLRGFLTATDNDSRP